MLSIRCLYHLKLAHYIPKSSIILVHQSALNYLAGGEYHKILTRKKQQTKSLSP